MKFKVILAAFLCLHLNQLKAQSSDKKIDELSSKIKFKNSQSITLKKDAYTILDSIYLVLVKNSSHYIIESHSSRRGNSEENLSKTIRRAKLIKQELVKRGVSPSRLSCKGFGGTSPIVSAPTRVGALENERIVIQKKE